MLCSSYMNPGPQNSHTCWQPLACPLGPRGLPFQMTACVRRAGSGGQRQAPRGAQAARPVLTHSALPIRGLGDGVPTLK